LAVLFLICLCAPSASAAEPGWLEPRGLSVVDLVGQVPESILQGTVLSSVDGAGLVVYESGTRTGNQVVITTTLYPRFRAPAWLPSHKLTAFGCLGQRPYFDHMGSVVPPSKLRVYDGSGAEVTSRIQYMYITNMGLEAPSADSRSVFRYGPEDDFGPFRTHPLPVEPDGLAVPANSGCRIEIPGADYRVLTGVFTLILDPPARVSFLGSQLGSFRSYIGPGDLGIMQPLMRQMRGLYPDRHGRIRLSIPQGADYLLVKFPPMPADPHTDRWDGPPYYNADRLSAGTYRLSNSGLSADLCFSGAFPLQAVWQDADQAPGSQFLPLLGEAVELAPPEYLVAVGVPHHECFTGEGDCPLAILQQIYVTEMSLEIIYLSVERPAAGGAWSPLRMAGPAWSPVVPAVEMAGIDGGVGQRQALSEGITPTHQVWLPSVARAPEVVDPNACPCGWFDRWGQMLDCIPRP